LQDIIRIIVLINLSKGNKEEEASLKKQIDKMCNGNVCIEVHDLHETLGQMAAEGLILKDDTGVRLTEQGMKLGKEWSSLLLKKEPILEVVAGLVDGSITSLVVVLSAFIASLEFKPAAFAALLTLASVAITNFSSFLLGGITADAADMMTLQALMSYSLSDIVDMKEREKSLRLIQRLFAVLHKEISRSNIFSAVTCGITTFLAGMAPMVSYFALPHPMNIIVSLAIVSAVVGFFLVRYRSRRSRIHWKTTLLETIVIVAIAVVASLLIGRSA
jgi:VIT1/CCC1 family predicted Fe2+/Mn2+ transporter